MQNITIISAFTAGILSFFSPCVFPLLGVYISIITGTNLKNLKNKNKDLDLDLDLKITKKYTILRTLFFILGFSFTFVILGVFAKYFSLFVFSNKKIFNFVIGLFLIFFGLHLLGFFRYIFSYRFTFFKKHSKIYSFLNFSNIEKRFDINKIGNKFQNLQKNNIGKLLWNFIFGVVFSFSWTPCVGPILGSILMLASAQESIKQSTHLLSIYSLGLALPFFTAVIFFDFLFSNFKKIFKYLNILQIFIGFVILFLGIFIINEKIL